eukprot:3937188-Rhodomonas_salina.3
MHGTLVGREQHMLAQYQHIPARYASSVPLMAPRARRAIGTCWPLARMMCRALQRPSGAL